MSEELKTEWLIRKGGYFYRPNFCGYTTSKHEAGRYTKEDAEREARVEPWHMKAIHESEWPDDVASRASPTVEKVEALSDAQIIEIAVAHSNYRDGPQDVEVFTHKRIVDFARDIEARSRSTLLAERDEARTAESKFRMYHRLAQESRKVWQDRATTAERERDEARRELADLRANWDASIQDMSEKFRAVNIERVAELTNQDAVKWCQENAARADKAERERDEARRTIGSLRKELSDENEEVHRWYNAAAYEDADGVHLWKDRATAAERERDGGHYTEKHGTAKAVADADMIVCGMLASQDDLAAANARIEMLKELVERAQHTVPETYANWHNAARAAITGGENDC